MNEFKSITLSKNGRKWLKSFHILFAGMWVTGGLTATLLIFLINADTGDELYGINKVIHFIDLVIIVIGNTGLLITGIIYAMFTRWGWFRYRWINKAILKWPKTSISFSAFLQSYFNQAI